MRNVGCMRGQRRFSFGLAWMMVVVAASAWAVRAQSPVGPDGNAHPPRQDVSQAGAELANPFGVARSYALPEEARRAAESGNGSLGAMFALLAQGDRARQERIVARSRFASELDLSVVRALPVMHSGRVKAMDTLARETVRAITGRDRHVEWLAERRGDRLAMRKLPQDPMFTLLDVMIDPAWHADQPLVHVNYLPLRRTLLERAFRGSAASTGADDELVDRWLRLGAVMPMMLRALGPELAQEHGFESGWREAFDRADRAMGLWENSWRNLMVVAPASRELPWEHLSSLPEGSAARRAALEVGEGWRALDAARVNRALRELASELGKVNPQAHAGARPALELWYNRAALFEWGMWLYAVAFVLLVLGVGTSRRWPALWGGGVLGLALAAHATGFVARCVLAERLAIQNQFESMTGLSLLATLVGVGLAVARRQWLFGAAAAGVGFMVLIAATQTGIPGKVIEREAAILNTSVLLKYHVTTVLTSYALIALATMVSVFYLATHYVSAIRPGVSTGAAGTGEAGVKPGRERTLHDLDRAQVIVLQLAFWTLGVGILLGAWWADHSWGRWWAFDPKETWALVTWIILLIVVHVRVSGVKRRGLVTAWLSVVGFFVMLWTYFGVNLLLPGLHAYA